MGLIMKEAASQIAVVGAGVIGLTSAMRLLEQGHAITIFARETPPHTTSDTAAAYWAPHEYGNERRWRWAHTSLHTFRQLVADPTCGVEIVHLYDLTDEDDVEFLSFDHEAMEEVPLGIFPAPWQGVRFTVPRIDVPIYMPWLLQRVQAARGQVQQLAIQNWRELSQEYPIIVNCTGLGAKSLTGDAVFPIRGQVIRVRRPPDLPSHIISAASATTTTYIVPRSQDCLLGGTFQFHDYNTQVDEEIATGILQRCATFYPALRTSEILQHGVGLRPGRDDVRLEVEAFSERCTLIHNYGHAAYGHTLSWGCAAEVASLVADLLQIKK
jgi:D-amino-acid oxidase